MFPLVRSALRVPSGVELEVTARGVHGGEELLGPGRELRGGLRALHGEAPDERWFRPEWGIVGEAGGGSMDLHVRPASLGFAQL